ncbi:integral membrane sensor signal transduction histidine kinase [[Clostridium] saccharolyticum WM1]|uniref:histidine kinase n=2 Tax=Lacrimispora TaxID=2719231 RepID=D9R4A9_LACSW|nr:histidine kinase [Lacrimispora saccharolytica]ADL04979.1 integral membrane sensor signal transduction histidine kinase [[Clostridium] saccharolyticum WM1]
MTMNKKKGQAKKRNIGLKRRMLYGILQVLIPVMVIITTLFWHTRKVMKQEYMRTTQSRITDIANKIDAKLQDIYSVSDNFAANDQLKKYIEKEYSPQEQLYKKLDIVKIYSNIFGAYDILNQRERISAIYTYKGELFNFLDPNNDTEEVIRRLRAMNIEDPDLLMKFRWFSLQDNFLLSDRPAKVRERKAVMGIRRIYSWEKARYEYVQLFALKEQDIYEQYRELAESIPGDIYVISENGSLISSSNEKAVESGELSEKLKAVILEQTGDLNEGWEALGNQMIQVKSSDVNDWKIVMVVPVKSVTKEVDVLYYRIFLVMVACVGLCTLMIFYLYKSFMDPIGKLNASMKEVYGGNLNAYVEVKQKNEVGDMIRYYNSMLERINTHIIEGLQSDRKKKELELEVLMSQINPHFLYNTLENIVWMSNEAGRPDIGRTAASLGRMYRLSISGGQVIVPMEHEIEHLMAYVKIQKNRYKEDFEFDLMTDMRQIHELYSLKIILQPAVENSFLYGMTGLKHPMMIRLTVKEKGGWVMIKIMDNGRGMDREKLKEVRDQIRFGKTSKDEEEQNRRSTGIGLHSIEARIKLYFGVDRAVSIFSKKDTGTLTVIRIPRITREDMDEHGNMSESSKSTALNGKKRK